MNFKFSRPRGGQQSPETFFIVLALFSHFQKGKLGLCRTSESWDINFWSSEVKSFRNEKVCLQTSIINISAPRPAREHQFTILEMGDQPLYNGNGLRLLLGSWKSSKLKEGWQFSQNVSLVFCAWRTFNFYEPRNASSPPEPFPLKSWWSPIFKMVRNSSVVHRSVELQIFVGLESMRGGAIG